MRAGPKRDPENSEPIKIKAKGSRQFELFAQRYVRVPRGRGVGKPLKIRPWQRELVASIWDADPRPRIAGWMLPRGNGKTTLCAALGLWDLFMGEIGASVVVCATDERQASICFGQAQRMVETSEALASRCQVFKDRIVVPARGASFAVLPAEPKRLEGLDFTLGIADEIGRIDQETWEVLSLASGKRAASVCLGIGTPSADDDSVLAHLRALADDDDSGFVWREFSADGFQNDHGPDCPHCWSLSNPGLGDLVAPDALRALLPPKTREASFRRARLCQLVSGGSEQWVTREVWDACKEPQRIIESGTPVVLGLDGSFSNDCTAVVAVSVEVKPRVQPVGIWSPKTEPDYRVPILEVEEAILQAARRWQVVELTADPYMWSRTLQVLVDQGISVTEFPQSAARLSPATRDMTQLILNREISHTGDPVLTQHVMNCTIRDDARGFRLSKVNRNSARKIDGAVAMVLATARARWWASQRPPSRRVAVFR